MAEELNNGAAAPADAATENGPSFSIEKIYAKDVSFEAPGTPGVFNEQAQPQLQMNMNQGVQRLNDNAYEVVLSLTLTCKIEDKSIYLAEVKQAGVFGLSGFDPQTLDGLLGSHCPSILYPYARQLVSDLIQAGGFPPFYLQPINFDALYAEGLRQRQAQQAAGDTLANTDAAGNA